MSPAIHVNDLSWLIGGPQGSGVDSSANVFARACAAGGLNVFGKREFYSNIMGEHSYFALRAHTNLVRSHIDAVNVLATFEAETVFRHARAVTDDGAIVYDPALTKTRLSDIRRSRSVWPPTSRRTSSPTASARRSATCSQPRNSGASPWSRFRSRTSSTKSPTSFRSTS